MLIIFTPRRNKIILKRVNCTRPLQSLAQQGIHLQYKSLFEKKQDQLSLARIWPGSQQPSSPKSVYCHIQVQRSFLFFYIIVIHVMEHYYLLWYIISWPDLQVKIFIVLCSMHKQTEGRNLTLLSCGAFSDCFVWNTLHYKKA